MKKYKEADQCFSEASAIYRDLPESATRVDVARTLATQGNKYYTMKKYKKADQCYAEALAVYRKLPEGATLVDVAKTLKIRVTITLP